MSAVGNYETSSALPNPSGSTTFGSPITWLGLTSVYTPAERELMSQLPLVEQTVLHALKSLCSGEIQNNKNAITANKGGGGSPTRGSLTRESPPSRGSVGTQSNSPPTPKPVYADPEDIPFGSDIKSAEKVSTTTKHPLGYAVVWTSGQGRWCKTKAGKGRHSVLNTFRIWRKWYERKGWTVYGAQANGCLIAKSKSAELHAITIR